MRMIKGLFKTTEPDNITMDQFRERRKFAENHYVLRHTNFHPTMDQRLLYFYDDASRHSGGYYSTH